MATVDSQTQSMPPAVLKKLNRMRGQLTRWMLVHGIGRWLLVLIGILAVDILLDRVFKMDFAQRLVMLVVMAGAAATYFAWRVIKPLLNRPNDDALIYEVENKNPGLKESLITGVQLAREKDLVASGVSPELAQATISQGLANAEAIDFGKSLNLTQHFQNWLLLLAGVIGFGLIGLGVANSEFMRTWFNRNIMLLDDQWPQGTYLEIAGAVDGKLILARGNDHRQIVTITEASPIANVVVSLEIDNPGGRTVHQMKPTGKLSGREHMFMFHNVSSTFRFRAIGGDDVTQWVNVELVEPPNIIELKMKALLPEYTGFDGIELNGAGPHSVLTGSQLQLDIKTNKPLTNANLKLGDEFFPMAQSGSDQAFSLTIPGGTGELRGGEYQFELEDIAGQKSSRSSKFKLTIKEDDKPKVRATLLGISGLVSARANLPIEYQALDEYGLSELAFDSSWKTGVDEETPGQRQQVFLNPQPVDGVPVRQIKDYAQLDLIPYNLTPGTSFRFSLTAKDTLPATPNVGKSQEFLLRVVSDDELRADLLRREVEQRKAFDDQAYQVQMELMADLEAVTARPREPEMTQEDFDAQRESVLINLIRKQKGVGTAMDRIANRFEEFLVEVKNNRLDEAENQLAPDQRIEARFDERIIKPIRRLDAELVTLATRHLDNSRRAVRDSNELNSAVDQAVVVQQQILEEMKRILAAMNDSESFQEIINGFLEVKKDTQEIGKGIEKKLKPKEVFDDDDDIFDK